MVSPPMSELQLVCLAAERPRQYLMAETDSEDRSLPDELSNLGFLIFERLGVAWTVGEKDAVRLKAHYVLSRGERGNNRYACTGLDQLAQNIALNSKIVRHHVVQRIA